MIQFYKIKESAWTKQVKENSSDYYKLSSILNSEPVIAKLFIIFESNPTALISTPFVNLQEVI